MKLLIKDETTFNSLVGLSIRQSKAAVVIQYICTSYGSSDNFIYEVRITAETLINDKVCVLLDHFSSAS